ncbi:hypothetical protein AVEN_246698-1 [Araneus ventricosus]|uniref:H15 domain-containing protein n=1 Tax=Araneus ventricosus TaxID=182803 RepID=A0A4Y2X5U2_ARAVE|nr:hypothetical protein AVEN_246698-1 [Araneus ventricosus]
METSAADKAKEKYKKIRIWILKAVEDVEGSAGATSHHIQNFLEFKQAGISRKQEWKLILKKLLNSGHLTRKDRVRYVVNKSRKDTEKSAVNKANE